MFRKHQLVWSDICDEDKSYNTVAVPLTAQRTKPYFQNLVRIRVIDLKKRDFYPFSAS